MRITVNNSKELYSQGRNGPAKTVAVELRIVAHYVYIQPITSRGEPQNCWIELDQRAMDKLAVLYLTERGVMSDDFGMSLLEEMNNMEEVSNG